MAYNIKSPKNIKPIAPTLAAIAKNIASMVENSGKSQAQIAKELNLDQTTISKYTLGKALPSVLQLMELCRVLNCTYEDILGHPTAVKFTPLSS